MRVFRKFFLFISLFQLLVSVECFAADPEAADAPGTPKHLSQGVPGDLGEVLTPGGLLSRAQAKVLKKERFEEVLGAEFVASLEINWGVLAQSDDSPHLPGKILNIRRLKNTMKELSTERYDDPFFVLLSEVSGIHLRMEAVHLKRLKGVVQLYFERLFPSSTVECTRKRGGVQLGSVVTITTLAGEKFKYYVKTHSEGKLTEKSTAPKRVNPREILVYMILFSLDLGCEPRFCARSPEDVYIATLDAKHGGEFILFEEAKKREEELGSQLWGSLGDIDRSPNNNDWAEVEAKLAEDEVSRHFVKQLSTVDLTTRLLRLSDLLNNPDNYGYRRPDADSPFVPRILDFRIPGEEELRRGDSLQFEDRHFGGFLEGNGRFQYIYAHPTVAFALHYRQQEERVRTAHWVLTEGPLTDISDAIEVAYASVSEFFNDNQEKFGADLDAIMAGLTEFRDILHNNCEVFKGKLEEYIRVHEEEAGEA